MADVIHTKIGEGRRVAVPAELCQRYGIDPGDPVVPEPAESGIVLRPLDAVIREVQTFFADITPASGLLSDELIRERHMEAGRESRDSEAVLDASALIAFLRNEPGADRVAAVLTQSCISAVNLAETISKLVEYGKPLDDVAYQIERLRIPVVPFDAEQAKTVASLWKPTRSAGLSLGDRACLSLALKTSLPALTTEREWGKCGLAVEVVKIR